MGDRSEHEKERTRADQEDILFPGILPERAVMRAGQHESRLEGDEHDDKIKRRHPVDFLVILFRKTFNVGPDGVEVPFQRPVALLFAAVHILFISCQ